MKFECFSFRLSNFLVLMFASWLLGGVFAIASDSSQEESTRVGFRVRVPLPVTSSVIPKLKRQLTSILNQAPESVAGQRAVVVLEFDTSAGKNGRGSELGACLAIARFMGESEFNKVETIAFVPSGQAGEPVRDEGGLQGHAVLIAIAANQFIMAPGAELGQATVDDPQVDAVAMGVYEGIASRRLKWPLPFVRALVDPAVGLYRIQTTDGSVRLVNDTERAELESKRADISDNKTLSAPGQPLVLTGRELKKWGLIKRVSRSQKDLSIQLGLKPKSLEVEAGRDFDWQAIRISLPDVIDASAASWTVDHLRNQLARTKSNMVIFEFDKTEGGLAACLRIAQVIAELDSKQYRTVGFVKQSVAGPAAVMALTCDDLLMPSEAQLGSFRDVLDGEEQGDRDDGLSTIDSDHLRKMMADLGAAKDSDWSPLMAMLRPELVVERYQHRKTRSIRLLCNEELKDLDNPQDWVALGPTGLSQGVDGTRANQLGLVRLQTGDWEQVKTFYQLESEPETLRPSPTDQFLERIAGFLSSRFVTPWLLFIGFYFLSAEMSAPGTGVPGFLAALCFVLFFWSQFLDGNAEWFEILLFVVGVVFVLMEIFVIPGFGIFGIGGLLMVMVSLVLASQSLPIMQQSPKQIVYSIIPVLGAAFGVIAAALTLRHVIPHSPYFRRLMLDPARRQQSEIFGKDPEAIVDWSHLEGGIGITTTRLFPAGKARIAGRVYDVISKGQMVNKGEQIRVVEAQGNRVVVVPVNAGPED